MKYRLSDIMTIIGGGTPKTSVKEYWGGSIPWLSVKNFNNELRYVYDSEKKITKAGFQNSSTKMLQKDDTIISARGTVGEIAMIPFPMAFNQSCYGLRAKDGIVTPAFLFYLVKFKVNVLRKNTHGSVFDTITRDTFDGIEVELPSLSTQNKIASLLGNLDDQIELNTKINKNLQAQAQALYKSWFTDYEPFDGVRPIAWVNGTVDDLAKEIVCGKTPSTKVKEYYGSDVPFITIPDMHEKTYAVTTERYLSNYGAASQAKKTLPPNSICVSCIGTAGVVTLVASESQTNQQINSIIPKDGYSPFYIYLLMQTLSKVINKLGQSGSTIVNLNKTQFGKIKVIIPSVQDMKAFDEIVTPLFALILKNQKENIRLSSLRDALLPQLMSGEIDISNITL